MRGIKSLVKTTLLGGLVVILPIALFLVIAKWVFGMLTGAIQPLTDVVMSTYDISELAADLLVLAAIIGLCFVVGAIARTRLGALIFEAFENRVLLKIAPGYSFIRETTVQFLRTERRPFSRVALVQIAEIDMLVTAFVTEQHADGSYTVFVPNGPNPMSGNIYHLRQEHVHVIDVSAEDAMRSVIGCGAGSAKLIDAYRRKQKQHTLPT